MPKLIARYVLISSLLLQLASGQNQEILAEYKIGIVGRDQGNIIYQAANLGAKDAALELSKKYSIDVELLIATPDISKGSTQQDALAKLHLDGADGFLISPAPTAIVENLIQAAIQEGKEVVFFENQLERVTPLLTILADEKKAGRLAAEAILKKLSTNSRVAILTSTNPSPRLKQRMEGARAALGYRRIEKVVTTKPNYHSAIRTIIKAEDEDRNDKIDGWLFLEDWPLIGMPALPWKPGRMPVVAIQSSPSAFIYADMGYIEALITYPYYQWGYQGVSAIVEKIHSNKIPEKPIHMTQPRIVDWRNFESYRDEWQEWLQ
jgi:ribose transport system substrate-binding protein